MSSREERQAAQLAANAAQAAIAAKAENQPGGGINQPQYRAQRGGPTWDPRWLRTLEQSGTPIVYDKRGNVIYNPADLGAAEVERARAAQGLPPSYQTKGSPSPQYLNEISKAGADVQTLRTRGAELDERRGQLTSSIRDLEAEKQRLLQENYNTAMGPRRGDGTEFRESEARIRRISEINEQKKTLGRQVSVVDAARTDLAKEQRLATTYQTKAALSQAAKTTEITRVQNALGASYTKRQKAESPNPINPRPQAASGVKTKLYANPDFMQNAESYTRPDLEAQQIRKERPKAQQGVTDKLFLNPKYVTKEQQRELDKTKTVTNWTLSLTENIGGNKSKPPNNFAISLTEGTPTKPKNLTQAEVDKMSPEQYAVYKAEIDSYNRFITGENKRIKKENTESLNKSLRELKTFIDEQKAAGTKTLVINTDQGEKRVPIGEAYLAIQRTKNVKGIYTDQVIPEGYTVAGLSNMVFIEAPQKTVGPEPTPYFAEQVKIERFTGLDLGGLAPITKGIDTTFETKKPVEGRSELNQRLTGVAAPFVNIGTIIYDTGKAVAKEIRRPGSGFEFRGTDIATGGNPLNLPYARSETPTQRTAFGTLLEGKLPDITRPYEQGTILGDIGLAALGAVRLKGSKPKATKEQIGQIPEGMRKPKTEAPSNLNDLYKPIPRLAKTPNQKFLEEIQMSETARKAMAERSKQISNLGADYARLRYDVTKGKIDLEQIGVRLGQGKVTTMRGKLNPRWEKSGEAPESTVLKEAQQRNIKANQQRSELDDILSEAAMKRMTETEKKPELDVVTQRELDELAFTRQANMKRNMENAQLDKILSEAAMKRMTESKPLFEETATNIGRGSPKLMRLKGNEIIEPSTKYKTTIEKIAELRKNPELEEREPLKFYPKRRLGEEDIDMPIDMTDRIDLGFQNLNLNVGEGKGFITPKEAQQRNIKANQQRSELDDILSEAAMKRMTETEKKPELDVVTQRELDELAQLKQKNIEQNIKKSREPMLLSKEAGKETAKKLDLQSQITQDLATRAGFKSTKVPLGRSRIEIVKTGVAGSALVGPMPFLGKVIAEEVPPDIPPLTNTTGTNQTEDLPPDGGIISAPASQSVTDNQNINAVVGRQGFASDQQPFSQTRMSRRSLSQNAVRSRSESKPRLALIPMSSPKAGQERKTRPLTIQQRVTALAQPTPNPSIPGLRPGQPFPPRQPPTLKTPPPPRRPPRILPAFIPKRKKESEKRKLKELKPNDFLGNASQENISTNYSRQEIILGIKRSAKQERKDLAKERKGLPRFVNTSTSPLLSKTKPNLIKNENKRNRLSI